MALRKSQIHFISVYAGNAYIFSGEFKSLLVARNVGVMMCSVPLISKKQKMSF